MASVKALSDANAATSRRPLQPLAAAISSATQFEMRDRAQQAAGIRVQRIGEQFVYLGLLDLHARGSSDTRPQGGAGGRGLLALMARAIQIQASFYHHREQLGF